MSKDNKKTILCPVQDKYRNSPGHLLYASNYFEEVGSEFYNKKIEVKYLYYDNKDYGQLITIILNFVLAIKVLSIKHDILYYSGAEPENLYLIAFLKYLKIYNKRIYTWSYVAINKSRRLNIHRKILYSCFDRIFMMTEAHVEPSVNSGYVSAQQVSYQKWGEDLKYVDSLKSEKYDCFTFISTGKAYRDFETLIEAFKLVKGARLKIYTYRHWNIFNYQEYLDCIKNPNIEVIYSDEIQCRPNQSILDYLFAEMQKCHCSLSICKDVNFGVGYTQVLDSLACSIPIIITWNKDNPIDVDKRGVGVSVPVYNIEKLAEAMNDLVSNNQKLIEMSRTCRKVVESEYNIKIVARNVLKEFLT